MYQHRLYVLIYWYIMMYSPAINVYAASIRREKNMVGWLSSSSEEETPRLADRLVIWGVPCNLGGTNVWYVWSIATWRKRINGNDGWYMSWYTDTLVQGTMIYTHNNNVFVGHCLDSIFFSIYIYMYISCWDPNVTLLTSPLRQVLSAVDLQLFILERPAASNYGWSNYDQMGVGIIATRFQTTHNHQLRPELKLCFCRSDPDDFRLGQP